MISKADAGLLAFLDAEVCFSAIYRHGWLYIKLN